MFSLLQFPQFFPQLLLDTSRDGLYGSTGKKVRGAVYPLRAGFAPDVADRRSARAVFVTVI